MAQIEGKRRLAAWLVCAVVVADGVQATGRLALCSIAPHSPPLAECRDQMTQLADIYAKAVAFLGLWATPPPVIRVPAVDHRI